MGNRWFQHSNALVESFRIGEGTRIGAFVHILAGAQIGIECQIHDGAFLGDDVVLGDRVTVRSGAQLPGSVTLEDDVLVGSHATFSNDAVPAQRTTVRKGASIGANATILPGLVIGQGAMVGPGAVVTLSVPANAIVSGNPANITGYVDVPGGAEAVLESGAASSEATDVRGVSLHWLPHVDDLRGALTFAEGDLHIPFEIRRMFLVYGVASREVRGEHAHRTLHQFLICVHGSCSVMADDGHNRREFRLEAPFRGLHIPPMVWATQYKHSPDAVLLVLASAPYDPADYIRDYNEFLTLVRSAQ